MATQTDPRAVPRIPLSRQRVLEAAVALADEGGIEALTMRRLAEELDVEAMSLYYHVANKDAILDGVVEVVIDEINQAVEGVDAPSAAHDWTGAMRARILAARQVLLRHRWMPEIIGRHTPMNRPVLRYFESLLGLFKEGGFSYELAHHALHALGSRVIGFSQELFEPDEEDRAAANEALFAEMAPQIPHLVEMTMTVSHDDPDSTLGWCDDQTEFEFGLDLLLDGLARLRTA
jgi:AcrR family transcriptional regulator